jgi:hypothetical protein
MTEKFTAHIMLMPSNMRSVVEAPGRALLRAWPGALAPGG